MKNLYLSHHEHLKDILNLSNFLSEYDSSTALWEHMSYIHMREQLTLAEDIFLPLFHISEILNLNKADIDMLYIITANSLSPSVSSDYLKFDIGYCSRPIKILLENDEDLCLSPRILSYLYSPSDTLQRPWLFIYHYDDCMPEIFPSADTLCAIQRLIPYICPHSPSESMLIHLWGKPGSGRKSHIRLALQQHQLSMITADLEQISGTQGFSACLKELVLEARLYGYAICLEHADQLLAYPAARSVFLEEIKPLTTPVFLVSEAPLPELTQGFLSVAEVQLPPYDKDTLFSIWKRLSCPYDLDASISLLNLCASFPLTPLQIHNCLDKAHHAALIAGHSTIQKDDLHQFCQACCTKKLSLLGTPLQSELRWKDLILPENSKALLASAINRIRHKETVLDQWGFSRRLPYGRGTALMLEGPPGTGKTMAAYVMAGELDMPLYRLQTAAIMSKYIGETEKNLQAVFEEAGQVNGILFFDEADALFGKRTEVKDSLDRFANLETAYLLQKLEEHEGVVILATNLLENIDDAFKRRLQYIIRFPLPDVTLRKNIWETVLPPEVPCAGNIDFDQLAAFELTGSNIKSIALSAAFMAVAEDRPLGMPDLLKAVREESSKTGIRSLPDAYY